MNQYNSQINSVRWKLWITLVLFLTAALPSSGLMLSLQPSRAKINETDYAEFNCSFSCKNKSQQTHTIYWLVGDAESLNDRAFVRREEHLFTATSGLHVEVEDISTCGDGSSGHAIEQLKINGSSAELFNRTTVQCVAIPRSKHASVAYSPYSVMIIYKPAAALSGSNMTENHSETNESSCDCDKKSETLFTTSPPGVQDPMKDSAT